LKESKKSRDEKGGVVLKEEENEPHWPTSRNQVFSWGKSGWSALVEQYNQKKQQ
jgi:hypothetical protein